LPAPSNLVATILSGDALLDPLDHRADHMVARGRPRGSGMPPTAPTAPPQAGRGQRIGGGTAAPAGQTRWHTATTCGVSFDLHVDKFARQVPASYCVSAKK
jgi:hypothetical protein